MEIDKATQTMIDNLHKNTGKTIANHGFANLIAHKTKGSDAGSAENQDDLITKQYQGKEHFKPFYDKLMSEILSYGKDVEIAPKNNYVSLRRKKQFAILNPATKTRFEIGINLKGQEPKGKLEAEKPNSMCSHKINITDIKDLDNEVFEWIKAAYENAG
jgi:predicted transport protein